MMMLCCYYYCVFGLQRMWFIKLIVMQFTITLYFAGIRADHIEIFNWTRNYSVRAAIAINTRINCRGQLQSVCVSWLSIKEIIPQYLASHNTTKTKCICNNTEVQFASSFLTEPFSKLLFSLRSVSPLVYRFKMLNWIKLIFCERKSKFARRSFQCRRTTEAAILTHRSIGDRL